MDLPQTLIDAVHYFSDRERCENLLRDIRWPDGVVKCPHCKSTHVRYMNSVNRWKCYAKHKRPQFSVRTNTIFEESAVSLSKWFVCLYLFVNAKNGAASWEIHRHVGVTQKTAWLMLQRIRHGLKPKGYQPKLKGEVQADETFVGGKFRNMHADKRVRARQKDNKVIVFGVLEKGGVVRTTVVPDRTGHTLQTEIKKNVAVGATIYTDELGSYKPLKHWYQHDSVSHEEGCYFDEQATTNDLEGYWSMLKRCIRSTYISVDRDHLPLYLEEQQFRYNSRKLADGLRFIEALKIVSKSKRITYKQLTQSHKRSKPRRGGPRKIARTHADIRRTAA